jgi:hypothetical protein
MNLPSPNQTWARWALLCLACVLLSSCAGQTAGEHLADMPHWMGGEPAGVPPRRGTPEYDEYMKERERKHLEPAVAADGSKPASPQSSASASSSASNASAQALDPVH